MKRSVASKNFAVAVAAIYFATQCVTANATTVNFWEKRNAAASDPIPLSTSFLPLTKSPIGSGTPSAQRALLDGVKTQLTRQTDLRVFADLLAALPAQAGSVRSIRLPAKGFTGKIAVHIEDVHRNAEAQKNISAAVTSLMAKRKIGILGLEGAFVSLQPVLSKRFPSDPIFEKAVAFALKENDISGAVHAAFLTDAPPPLVAGIDDRHHYDLNVEAVRRAAPKQAALQTEIARADETLTEEKQRVFNPALASFDGVIQRHRHGQLPFADYIETLARYADKPSTNFKVLVEALAFEKNLDFHQVERERSEIIEKLTARLSPSDISDFARTAVAFRQGEMSQEDFYRRLENRAERCGLDLTDYKAMNVYIHYVALSDRLNLETLFPELHSLENTIEDKLARSDQERALLAAGRELYLRAKLASFSMTREEWKEYKNVPRPSCLVPRDGHDKTPSSRNEARGTRDAFESFYREAEARDRAMAENLSNLMEANGQKLSVIVAGGFHEAGLTRELNDRGIATLSFVPTITDKESEEGNVSLDAFTREKSPLEKLFAGENSFLAPSPIRNRDIIPLNSTALEADARLQTDDISNDTFHHYGGSMDVSLHAHRTKRGIEFNVTRGKTHVDVNYSIHDGEITNRDEKNGVTDIIRVIKLAIQSALATHMPDDAPTIAIPSSERDEWAHRASDRLVFRFGGKSLNISEFDTAHRFLKLPTPSVNYLSGLFSHQIIHVFHLLANQTTYTNETERLIVGLLDALLGEPIIPAGLVLNETDVLNDPRSRLTAIAKFRDRLKTDDVFRSAVLEEKYTFFQALSLFTRIVVNVPKAPDQWQRLTDEEKLNSLTTLGTVPLHMPALKILEEAAHLASSHA